mgnify:CR=1 FL=1
MTDKIMKLLKSAKTKSAHLFDRAVKLSHTAKEKVLLLVSKIQDFLLFIMQKLSLFLRFIAEGHGIVDSVFSSLYIRACERGLDLNLFHRISSPVAKLSSFAKGRAH